MQSIYILIMPITKADLLFDYPEALIAQSPIYPPRALVKAKNQSPKEIQFKDLIQLFGPHDVLVINSTKVLPRRIFLDEMDILFLESSDELSWSVLFQAKKFNIGDCISLPGDVKLTLKSKGRPQKVIADKVLEASYFERYGHFALPPYIQKARGQNLPKDEDKTWYQTAWAEQPGSLAAPTASLHFKDQDIASYKAKIKVVDVTLHVGLGTFLPITAENLNEHQMHTEYVEIKKTTLAQIKRCAEEGGRVWALGTTALRSLEAFAQGHLQEYDNHFAGQTDLFIKPGDEFKIVTGLLTNFHQPGSTLMALVSAFSSLNDVHLTYKFAIEQKFRLFSYGDLSVWY